VGREKQWIDNYIRGGTEKRGVVLWGNRLEGVIQSKCKKHYLGQALRRQEWGFRELRPKNEDLSYRRGRRGAKYRGCKTMAR